MVRRRPFNLLLILLMAVAATSSCAPPWKKKRKKTFPRSFMGATLGMTPKQIRREVQADQVNKHLLRIDKPSIEVKKIEFKTGPAGEYVGWITVYYYPLSDFSMKRFVKEHFAILGKPSRTFFDKDKKTGADHEGWVWQDRKTMWDLRRITFPDNPKMADFKLGITDMAFLEVLQNTDTGMKRKFQREMLRTGNF